MQPAFPMILQSGRAAEDVKQFVRARRLLAVGFDRHRAIVGEVSREWIESESERSVRWERLPEALQERFRPPAGKPPERVNSNWLPKLEPALNGAILAGIILFGARIFGRGTPDRETGARLAEVDMPLVIAAIIIGTFGLRDTYSAFIPGRQRLVDEGYLAETFGVEVMQRVWALRERIAVFDMALGDEGGPLPSIEPEHANAIAALKAARLRLTARAAGDGIFATLDGRKLEELHARGVDPGPPGAIFPERAVLERDCRAARAAISLGGVDDTIREPVRDVLIRSVDHVLHHGTPPRELVGKYGSAIHNFHCSLPLWEHYSPINRRTVESRCGELAETAGPFALGTLFMTSLEVTRYLHNVRRKGGRTGAGHCFLVAADVERLLGLHVSVPVVAGADCHDVIEDGSFAAAGYDQNLELFASRFGAPLAALVAEVTDSFSKEDGPVKAAATVRHACLVPMEQAYNLGQLAELQARATDPDRPYTLQGIIMKLADLAATQLEGLHDPDLMGGPWRHSGARVTWEHSSKGRIARPLLERLRVELRVARTDPYYHEREGNLPPGLLERVREVLAWSIDVADLYAAQNVTILAGEHGLDAERRRRLLDLFFDGEPGRDGALATIGALLPEELLAPEVLRRGLAATHRLVPDGPPVRDLARLMDYRDAVLWRQAARRELDLPARPQELAREVEEHTLARLFSDGAPPGEPRPEAQNAG